MKRILIMSAICLVNIAALQAMRQPPKMTAEVSLPAKKSFMNHTQQVSSVGFLDNNQIVTGSLDGTAKIIDIGTSKIVYNLQLPGTKGVLENPGLVTAVAGATPNIVYVASATKNFPLFFNSNTGAFTGHGQVSNGGHTQRVTALAVVSPESVVTGSQDGSVVVLYSSFVVKKFNIGKPVTALAVVNPTTILAISSEANGVYILNPVSSQMQYLPLPAGFTRPQSIGVLNATRWAFGLRDGRIIVLDSTYGKNVMKELTGHVKPVLSLSPIDATYLVSGSADGNVIVWNANPIEAAKKVITLAIGSANAGAVYSVAAKLNVQTGTIDVIAGCNDGSVWLWEFNLKDLVNK